MAETRCPNCRGEILPEDGTGARPDRCGNCGTALLGPSGGDPARAGKTSDAPPVTPEPTGGTAAGPGPGTTEQIPARLGGCRIVREIGRGGMGTVYEAIQESLGRRVALKVLPESLARDPEFVKRFAREAGTLARLSHPGIVAVYDRGSEEGHAYFVMEYVASPRGDPENLSHVLEHGRLPEARVLGLAVQILEALAHAHAEGIIHRDLKPANILIDRAGRTKVVDFGIAAIIDARADDTQKLTLAGISLGTPAYMPPEQRLDARHADARADVYAFGVMLFQMLTGIVPSGMLEPPGGVVPGLDAGWDPIVERCVRMAPDRRYADAGSILADVRALEKRLRHASAVDPLTSTEAVVTDDAPPAATGGSPAASERRFAEERTRLTPVPGRTSADPPSRTPTLVVRSRADAAARYVARDLHGAREAVKRGLSAAPDDSELLDLSSRIEADLIEFASLTRRAGESLRAGNLTLASELSLECLNLFAREHIGKAGAPPSQDPVRILDAARTCESALRDVEECLRRGSPAEARRHIAILRGNAPESPRLRNLDARVAHLEGRRRSRRIALAFGSLALAAAVTFAVILLLSDDPPRPRPEPPAPPFPESMDSAASAPHRTATAPSEDPADDAAGLAAIEPLLRTEPAKVADPAAAADRLRTYLARHPRSRRAEDLDRMAKRLDAEPDRRREDAASREITPYLEGDLPVASAMDQALAALRRFLEEHPRSPRAPAVAARLTAVEAHRAALAAEEERAFATVTALLEGPPPLGPDLGPAIDALRRFATAWPDSTRAPAVMARLATLEGLRAGRTEAEERDFEALRPHFEGQPADAAAADEAMKALRRFRETWPQSPHIDAIAKRLGQIETIAREAGAAESRAWSEIASRVEAGLPDAVIEEEALAALRDFLSRFPHSTRAGAVTARIAAIEARRDARIEADRAAAERIRPLLADMTGDEASLAGRAAELRRFRLEHPDSSVDGEVASAIQHIETALEERRSASAAAAAAAEVAAWERLRPRLSGDPRDEADARAALDELRTFERSYPISSHAGEVRSRIAAVDSWLRTRTAPPPPPPPPIVDSRTPAPRTVRPEAFYRYHQLLEPFADSLEAIEYGSIRIEAISPDPDTTSGANWTAPETLRSPAGLGRIRWAKGFMPVFEVTERGNGGGAAAPVLEDLGVWASHIVTRMAPWPDPRDFDPTRIQWRSESRIDGIHVTGSGGGATLLYVIAKEDRRDPRHIRGLPIRVETDMGGRRTVFDEILWHDVGRDRHRVRACTIRDGAGRTWRLQVPPLKGLSTTRGNLRIADQIGIRRFDRIQDATVSELSARHFREGLILTVETLTVSIQ